MNRPTTDNDLDVARTLGADGSSGRGHHVKRWLAWGAAGVVLALILVFWARGENGQTVRFKTEDARRGDLTVTVTATGTLQPTNEVEVGIEVSGTIESVDVDYNDHVKRGQVLARLDLSKLEGQVLQSKALLEAAQAKVMQARATAAQAAADMARLERVRKMSGGKVPSQTDLDAAKATLERARADEASAQAAVSQARATLDVNQTDLTKGTIHSPIDGVVLTRNVEPGQTVAASFQAPVLFTLAEDLTKMELYADVDEADVGQVEVGQKATFTVDAYPDRTFEAKIKQVRYASQTIDGVVSYQTILDVSNPDLLLRPGMTATADIVVRQIKDALLVPNAALRFTPPARDEESTSSGGSLLGRLFPRPRRSAQQRSQVAAAGVQQRVWVLRDGHPVAINITTGPTDGIMTVLRSGDVKPGTPLLVDTIDSGG